MSNLSRRSLVASAAALPALAVPAIATDNYFSIEPDTICTQEELAALEFEAMPQYATDGIGAGTPEFRETLEGNLRSVAVGTRMAFVVLGKTKQQLIEIAQRFLDDDQEDVTIGLIDALTNARKLTEDLVGILQAAEIRSMSALAYCCDKAVQS